MKRTALDRIAPLLDVLRAHPALREVRPTVFHLNGRDFLHFHIIVIGDVDKSYDAATIKPDEPGGVFADVRLTKGFVRMPVSSRSEQAELLERIDQSLSSLDSRVRDRQRRGRRRQP
jgi:hypothetical protein